jgi:5-methylcytosine-specific restriction endonuclease McrA
MCRNASYCTELGEDTEKWSRTCPLPPPDFFQTSFNFFIAAYELAIQEKIIESIAMLDKTESDRLRYWYEEHGQMSGWHHRVKILALPKPNKFNGEVDPNKRISPFEADVYKRDGFKCRYCGIRVISPKALKKAEKLFGKEIFVAVGKGNSIRHGIALTFRATADHVLPLSFGGRTNMDNLVTSCWNCNYGKYNVLIEQMGVTDPRLRPPVITTNWDGLSSTL